MMTERSTIWAILIGLLLVSITGNIIQGYLSIQRSMEVDSELATLNAAIGHQQTIIGNLNHLSDSLQVQYDKLLKQRKTIKFNHTPVNGLTDQELGDVIRGRIHGKQF